MGKSKMTKDIVPDNFTISLAVVDSIPVLFFGATMVLLGTMFSNPLFLIGALLVLFAGACKVAWKFVVVLAKKNIWWMFLQMRIAMPIGFVLMLISVLVDARKIDWGLVWRNMCSMPSAICFIIGLLGMVLMTVFAFTLDGSKVKSNWIEQGTNGIAQAAFFVGVLLLL